MAQYFIFSVTEGDPWVHVCNSKRELLDEMRSEGGYINEELGFAGEEFHGDMWMLGDKYLIIKGTIVQPTPMETVTVYDVD